MVQMLSTFFPGLIDAFLSTMKSLLLLRLEHFNDLQKNTMSMFKQDSASAGGNSSAETIIGPSVKVEGDLNAVGNVAIEGMVNGTISTDKDIRIGVEADVQADIKAQNATIAGKVKGKLSISGKLNLESTAKITGDVSTGTISIENGAEMNGQVTMGSAPVSPANYSSEKKGNS